MNITCVDQNTRRSFLPLVRRGMGLLLAVSIPVFFTAPLTAQEDAAGSDEPAPTESADAPTEAAEAPSTAPAPRRAADTGTDDLGDTVFLSPFEVDASADAGWRSTNTTSGTSLNTPIKELPMSIEVINEDFLDDTGATNFRESLIYSAGVQLNEFRPSAGTSRDGNNSAGVNETTSNDRSASSRGGLGGRFSNAVSIRGFNVPFQNRDGFRYGGQIAKYSIVLGGIVDTVNLNRMEVVRGPNSLLYGIGVLSGITNMVPKRPLSAPSYAFSFGAGNLGYMRGDLDLTGPLKKDLWGGVLSYRVAAALQKGESWTDYNNSERQYYVGQLEFQNDKWNVFFEAQHATRRDEGIGPQFVYDNTFAAIDFARRNEYWEQTNWQKDVLGMPQSSRISGPDTYDEREETDLLFNVDYTPIENLTISAGMFLTEAEEETFDFNVSTLTNIERGYDFKDVIVQRYKAQEAAYAKDPALRSSAEQALAEGFPATRDWFETYADVTKVDLPQAANDPRDFTDYRFVRYWWRKKPETSSTDQYRVRATYTFETPDFFKDARMRHTFLAGYHYIKDEAAFTTGAESIGRQFAAKGELADDDPLLERHILDPSPFRYNGEELAMPGREYRQADVWYESLYALYQGQWLNNNLGIIAGVRQDEYHYLDRQYDRFNEYEFISEDLPYGPEYDGAPVDIPLANAVWRNPNNETFGFVDPGEGVSEYLPGPEPETATTGMLAVNYRITPGLTVYGLRAEGVTPNIGERDGNLDGIPSEQSTSDELGLKFDLFEGKLSGTISAYRIVRENAIWYLDSAPRPISWYGGPDPEDQTPPDASSFYPEKVASGEFVINYNMDRAYFADDGVVLGAISKIIYDDEGNPIKRVRENPEGYIGFQSTAGGDYIARDRIFLEYSKLDLPVIDVNGVANGKTWRYYLEKAFADVGRSRRDAAQTLSGPEDYNPVYYGRVQGTGLGVSPSDGWRVTGSNVTYTDEATGYDMQLIYQPFPSWQMTFTYAHTEREPIEPFDLVDLTDPVTGLEFGTEYDRWVRTFGREAFGLEEHDDDGDGVFDRVTRKGENEVLQVGDVPTSSLTGGIQGLNLYTGPEDSASFFTKYSFLEGPVKGLEGSLGVIWTGPALTSVIVGGAGLAENLYGTPPTPDRVVVNAGLNYKFRLGNGSYVARLNIYNLLDDQKGESFIDHTDPEGDIIPRRTVRYYTPRSFRLSLSAAF